MTTGVLYHSSGLEVTGGHVLHQWIDRRSADRLSGRWTEVVGVGETSLRQGVQVFPNPANELPQRPR